MKKFFEYRTIPFEEINELIKIEPQLAQKMDMTSPFRARVMPDHYQCFIHSVISQQLTSATVDSIWNKLVFSFKKLNPKVIAKATTEQLSAIGLSPQKIALIKKVTYDILDKKLNLDKLEKLSNEEIKAILTKYKGLGDGTADMMLMFSYYRNNVLPISDYGIRMGLIKLYGEDCEKDLQKGIQYHQERLTIFSFCLGQLNQK